MKSFFLRIILIFLLLQYIDGYSWGITGHRVVSEIAERHLSKKAKKNLKKIIGNQKLSYFANWPDFIKSDSLKSYKETEIWHYVNVNHNLDYQEFEKSLKEVSVPNLYSQILKEESILKNNSSSQKDKEFALRFLIHLVADLHQPLHVGRAEDQGGNLIPLVFDKENTNLHSLWDTKLVDYQKYSYTEFAEILDKKNKEEIIKIQGGTLESWFYESYKKAEKIYAQTSVNGVYGNDYNYKFSGFMENQLTLGGIRLAKILNEVLQ